jgi:KipI family sensor histidine kinase inhibitor
MIKNISNLGDAALYCDFGKEVNKETNTKVINFFKNIINKKIEGITNLTPSYNKLIISFDLKKTNFRNLKSIIEEIELDDSKIETSKRVKIPVCCENDFALDIERLEKKLSLNRNEIYQNFLNKEYFCYMTGFIAGMPFLGDLDENMRVKRLETPRVKVPRGSVGITEQFANVYTFESPGGWNIIGNTPLKIFDTSKNQSPNLISPGDTVIFEEIKLSDYKKML